MAGGWHEIHKLEGKVLDWKEAEELFLARRGYAAADYYALEAWSREMGFTITRVTNYAVVARAQRQLGRIIADGGNLADFEAWAATSGEAWSAAYTSLVFRMAVFGAYNSARFQQINDPAVRKYFDILVYDAVSDARTRLEHAQMNGQSWKRADFPDSWWPPNGFNCRCEVRCITQSMEAEGGWNRQPRGRTPGDVAPDVGFHRTPTDNASLLRMMSASLRQNMGAAGA